jgi:hypothetical protein
MLNLRRGGAKVLMIVTLLGRQLSREVSQNHLSTHLKVSYNCRLSDFLLRFRIWVHVILAHRNQLKTSHPTIERPS